MAFTSSYPGICSVCRARYPRGTRLSGTRGNYRHAGACVAPRETARTSAPAPTPASMRPVVDALTAGTGTAGPVAMGAGIVAPGLSTSYLGTWLDNGAARRERAAAVAARAAAARQVLPPRAAAPVTPPSPPSERGLWAGLELDAPAPISSSACADDGPGRFGGIELD